MDEHANRVFDASSKLIGQLQELAAFFELEHIFSILVRTKVIHRLFESSPELDINKLELYHLQFTESIIELLRTIRKSNEQAVNLLFDEIKINETLIEQFNREGAAEAQYCVAAQRQAMLVNESIFRLYQNLSDYSRDNPFPSSLLEFSKRYAGSHFHMVDPSMIEALTQYNLNEEYKNGYGIIDKKLLGLQCKHGFDNTFICGLKSDTETLEIYKMNALDTYFLFYPRRKFYNDFDPSIISDIDLHPPQSVKIKMARELSAKNDEYRRREQQVRKAIPAPVRELLLQYLNRITALNFLDTSDHEVQANILRTMLNTNGL